MLNEGKEIKDYTLKQFLGRGGFGEVWLAEKKIEIADKKVPFALKFLSSESHTPNDHSTVRREINTWIDASGNKNVVSVLDGFIHENYFVIVSEYANNGSLREWLANNGGKSPSLDKTVEMMSGILDGLSHLHAQNIIHRDLKPENILLKGDVPCIVDFGVSRMVETVSLTSSQLGTNSAGSPLYMSPESFERTKPSPQIDIWSAGVMLFEMLSGKTPYTAETIPALIYEIVAKEPRELPDGVPVEFQKVVKRALSKDVSQRFSTAKEMREGLLRALYSNNSAQNVSDEDFVTTIRQENNKKEISGFSAQTAQSEKSDFGKTANGNKKTLAFAGIGAAAILAASIGVFTIYRIPASNNSNENNVVESNQEVKVETVNNVNSVNENTENNKSENPPQSLKEAQISEKSNRQTPAKTESVPNIKTQKPATKSKKKVTLDELIGDSK